MKPTDLAILTLVVAIVSLLYKVTRNWAKAHNDGEESLKLVDVTFAIVALVTLGSILFLRSREDAPPVPIPKPSPPANETSGTANAGASPKPTSNGTAPTSELPPKTVDSTAKPVNPESGRAQAPLKTEAPTQKTQSEVPDPEPPEKVQLPHYESLLVPTSPMVQKSKKIRWTYQPGTSRDVQLPIRSEGDTFSPRPEDNCTVIPLLGSQAIRILPAPASQSCKEIDFSVTATDSATVVFYVAISPRQ